LMLLFARALHARRAPTHSPPISSRLSAFRNLVCACCCAHFAFVQALAIYGQDDCKSAWLTKAQALHALGRHEEALSDMQALAQTFQNDAQVTHAVQKASFEVRRAKRPKYYELLEIPTVASALEIKAAYKQRALEWHPDKHNGSDEAKREAEERFKLLGEALEILGDDFQRRLYDDGYDKEAIVERVQAANRAANQHDRDGCCNRGGGGCGGGCG